MSIAITLPSPHAIHKVERISNGYILIMPDGTRRYEANADDLMAVFTERLRRELAEQNRHDWSGNFDLNFAFIFR